VQDPPSMTDMTRYDISVVIPTHNRSGRLRRVLDALRRQKTKTDSARTFNFEVIIVADGCTDDTLAMLDKYLSLYPLQVIAQENAGPAAARNRGVSSARGEFVLFIDDDVIPEPGCVAAHVSRHEELMDYVVIGPMLTPTDVKLSPWVAWEQRQLEKQYFWFRSHPRATDHNFYTGNASVARDAFNAVGGFDSSFQRAEDVELAYRLQQDGQSFIFEPGAQAFHYAERSLESWIQTAYDYGYSKVRFARMGRTEFWSRTQDHFLRRHPVQQGVILMLAPRRRLNRLARSMLRIAALTLDRVGLRTVGGYLLSGLYGLTYYNGVSDGVGSANNFVELMNGRFPKDDLSAIFILEQNLGHITHANNLAKLMPEVEGITSTFIRIDPSLSAVARRIPGWSNQTMQAGLRSRRAVRQVWRGQLNKKASAMFVHTQVPAILLGRWMEQIPTVVSLDATPRQYDDLGSAYAHEVGSSRTVRVRMWANRRCFARARHLIAWSEWAKQGLVDDYDVDPDKVTVIPPGIDIGKWARPTAAERPAAPVRVLFVGGDLEREGGLLLIQASRQLHSEAGFPEFEIHLVTQADIFEERGVFVHRGLEANSPELIDQYHLADIFCLPTSGDCLPMVLAEAGAASLPLISTDIAAIGELVRDGDTGRLIRPGSLDDLVSALRDLVVSPEKRTRYGHRARLLVEQQHNAIDNSKRIASILRELSGHSGLPHDRRLKCGTS
jgi:glycosyltransferase involved in cell wall biosynthesis